MNWQSEQPATVLARLSRLFCSGQYLLETYTEKEVSQLLWELIGASGELGVLFDPALPIDDRLETIATIKKFYGDVFLPCCQPLLLHGLRETPPEISPLNTICYMWWDIFPTWGKPEDPQAAKIDSAIMELLGELLQFEHAALRESAAHGLGHWHLSYAGNVEGIIDRFLESKPSLSMEMQNYLQAARAGCVN